MFDPRTEEIKLAHTDKIVEFMEGEAWPLKAGFLLMYDLMAAGREGKSALLRGRAYRDVRECLEQLKLAPKDVRAGVISAANHAALLIDKIAREYVAGVKAAEATKEEVEATVEGDDESGR